VIGEQRDIKERLEQARGEYDRAERDGQLERAAELRFGVLPALEKELAAAHERLRPRTPRGAMLKRRSAPTTSRTSSGRGPAPGLRLLEGETAKLLRWRTSSPAGSSASTTPCGR
jgi:ATP-dependent Clp protease ATP-binding subunit ClpB